MFSVPSSPRPSGRRAARRARAHGESSERIPGTPHPPPSARRDGWCGETGTSRRPPPAPGSCGSGTAGRCRAGRPRARSAAPRPGAAKYRSEVRPSRSVIFISISIHRNSVLDKHRCRCHVLGHDTAPSPRPRFRIGPRQRIAIAMLVGVAVGAWFPDGATGAGFHATDLQILSTLFLRMIESLIVPLLFGTLVAGDRRPRRRSQAGRHASRCGRCSTSRSSRRWRSPSACWR